MHRSIIGFHQDLEQDWVADLDCGHCQHTRHEPPFFPRPWVITAAGRLDHIGQPLNCLLCDRQEMPQGYAPYRRTPIFTQDSIPPGLRSRHSTKSGIWGLIHIQHGNLRYIVHEPYNTETMLDSTRLGVVLPNVEHRVEPNGAVDFFVEFWGKASTGNKIG